MTSFKHSELILNHNGSLYHLDLKPGQIAKTIFMVGDPARVAMVSNFFDRIEFRGSKREFHTHTGYIGDKRLSVISSGIGTDNVDIVINEIDALFNIDLDKRKPKDELTSLKFIRLGTSGALQADLDIDIPLVSEYGLGIDSLMNFYKEEVDAGSEEIEQSFIQHLGDDSVVIQPYVRRSSQSLYSVFAPHFETGITTTCCGFYGPQGRQLRAPIAFPFLLDKLASFRYGDKRITNFEMETAGIYGLGKILGHECLSINAIIANRSRKVFSGDYKKTVHEMISRVLEILLSQ